MKLEVAKAEGDERYPYRLVYADHDEAELDLGYRFPIQAAAFRMMQRLLRKENAAKLAERIAKVVAQRKAAEADKKED